MPAQSQQQQKLFGLALSVKRGETPRSEASKEVLDIVDSMTEKQIEDFAGTSHSGLPKKVESALRELIKNAIKDNVVGDIVKEHKDCGCGCKGTTVGGCNTSLTEGVKLSLVDPNTNKFIKTLSLDRTYREAEKEVETLNRRLSPSQKTKGLYWKVTSINESVNESSVEIGDTVFLKSANKIATVIDRMGRSVTVKTGDGKKVKTVINNIKTLAQDNVNEKLDNKQLALLKYAYKDIKKINPSEPAYGRMVKHLDTLSKSELQQLADAGINFISLLAKNRLMRSESVSEAVPTQTKWAVAIASLTATRPDAVQKFIDDNNLNSEKLYQFLKKSNASSRFGGFAMDFVTAISGKPGNPIQKKMIKMFGESVNEYNVNKKFGSKYDIGAGSMGNGTTFWNRAEEEFGDYKKIAHVSDNGEVKFYDKTLPSNVKKHIEDYAKTQKESVNEAASRTAMEIGGLTGMNKDAVQKFVDEHNLDIEKLFQYVKKGKLKERMDFVSAVVGNPGNKIQKMIIAKFGMK